MVLLWGALKGSGVAIGGGWGEGVQVFCCFLSLALLSDHAYIPSLFFPLKPMHVWGGGQHTQLQKNPHHIITLDMCELQSN